MKTLIAQIMVINILLITTCLTIKDVKDEGCRVLCVRDGHTGGKSIGLKLDNCECSDVKSYEELTNNSVNLGPSKLEEPKKSKSDYY